jgi:sporulation-control protein spo0M
MKTLRMEVVYFVVDSSIDDKELEYIAFYKNQNKTILLKVDRRQRAKFDGLRTLILNKDYNTILDTISKDLGEKYESIEVVESSLN